MLLTWAKELGCNFVRLAHYPHNAHMMRVADELGLLVWSEVPVYWTIRGTTPGLREREEPARRDGRARPQPRLVVLWSVANETPVSEPRNTFLQV